VVVYVWVEATTHRNLLVVLIVVISVGFLVVIVVMSVFSSTHGGKVVVTFLITFLHGFLVTMLTFPSFTTDLVGVLSILLGVEELEGEVEIEAILEFIRLEFVIFRERLSFELIFVSITSTVGTVETSISLETVFNLVT